MTVPEVVTCGEAMMLLLAEPGVPLGAATYFRPSIAGAESNVATGLARLGHSVRWLGRVGADSAGETVMRSLRGDGVDCSRVVVDPQAPTGLLIRESHPARPIDVQYRRAGSAASRLHAAELHADMVTGARLVHVTGITAMLSPSASAAVDRLIELARAAGATVSFDPNVRLKLGDPARWRETVLPLLSRADLVFAGADELELLGEAPAEAVADRLLADGVSTLITKNPDKSATLRSATESRTVPAFRVPVTDPVGAGDAFAAGYLSAWLRGTTVQRALTEAAAVAALVVQCAADVDGLPTAAGRDRALAVLAGDTDACGR